MYCNIIYTVGNVNDNSTVWLKKIFHATLFMLNVKDGTGDGQSQYRIMSRIRLQRQSLCTVCLTWDSLTKFCGMYFGGIR
jgi:hypothetical protein